jgi:hypothetical protein
LLNSAEAEVRLVRKCVSGRENERENEERRGVFVFVLFSS